MQVLAQLQARRDELLAKKAAYLSEAQAQRNRAADWQRKYDSTKPRRRDENDLNMVADANNQARIAEGQAADVQKQIEVVDAQIKDAEKDIQQYNAALADATKNGLTGAAAEVAAQATVEAAKSKAMTYKIVGITVAALVLIIAAVFAWRKLRKRS